MSEVSSKLVDAQGLLDALFHKDCQPSLRWVREMQAKGIFPYYKIGGKVYFDVSEVMSALRENCLIQKRYGSIYVNRSRLIAS
ncbi:MAG: hypothetical protein ACI92G_003442 [Candidatus Pelagisphaera sp.]|jgi:hypothetical protein